MNTAEQPKTLNLRIPQSVKSNYDGYASLLELFNCYLHPNDEFDVICTNFRANTWFESNLLPIIYAFVAYGNKEFSIISSYDNQPDCRLHKLLIRNNFAKLCFRLEHKPRTNETAVPFKVFPSNATYQFANYIDSQIVRYFPRMDERVKRDLSSYIQELFGNAQIHGNCRYVYTCGQHYPRLGKMDFTIVNLGTTIRQNVDSFLLETNQALPVNSIEWAVEPEHSTKRDVSGGIGLSLMRDFIHFNKGKFQIISGNEFWELSDQYVTTRVFPHMFPGTIVNIEIDQNDRNFYHAGPNTIQIEDLF